MTDSAVVEELLTTAHELLSNGYVISAAVLIKDTLELLGMQDRAKVLRDAVAKGIRIDPDYLAELIKEIRAHTGLKEVSRDSTVILSTEVLLLVIAATILILTAISALPPLAEAIAIPLATLLIIVAVNSMLKRKHNTLNTTQHPTKPP